MAKIYQLPEWINLAIQEQLKMLSLDINDSKKIAESVLKMSDYYIRNPDSQTPWNETWCQIAQIAYFFPLNYLRAQYVFEEAQRLSFFHKNQKCVEIGYGLGALTFHLNGFYSSLTGFEISHSCKKIFESFRQRKGSFEFRDTNKFEVNDKTCLCFSYSLTESISMRDMESAESLLIIEPSTHQDARKLQILRDSLLEKEFYAWAPCTHQDKCPLILNSQKDWCHHRIFIEMPEWFQRMEMNLPFKNKTLTFSYLLMSKRIPEISLPQQQKVRVIGDILEENGKNKALVCRGSQREFISVLHRESKTFPYYRGDVVILSGETEKKGNELRLKLR